MANKNLDTPSFVPRLPMSALREKAHLQKRLFEYDQEEEKQLRKIKQNQECLMKDLGGSGLDRQNAPDLLAKQKKLMELRRARFSAPAFTTMKRENLPQLSGFSSMEDDIDVKFQDLLLLTSGKPARPSSALKSSRPTSSSSQFSAPFSTRESSLRKGSEDRTVLVNRAGSKQGKISLNPPPLQLNSSAQQHLRLNDERLCKSSLETARTELADLAIVDIEQDVENEWSSGDKEDQKEFWKELVRRGTSDSGVSATQSVTTQEGRKDSARKSQEAGVSRRKDEKKRRRKIGIQQCVNEIAPAFNETVHLNEGSSTLFIDLPRESRSLLSTMSFREEQRAPTAAKPDDSNNGPSVNNAMQTGRASSAAQINKSDAGNASLSVGAAAEFRLHGNTYTDINTPRLKRKMSRNQRTLSRCSSELDLVGKKDCGSHLDASDACGDSAKSSVTQAVAVQNFRRLNFLSLATNPCFSGSEKSKKNSASAKMQPERKLSRARLEELQKPTESSATKHRSISVSGAHPTLHGNHSPPELRRGSPSGLRNFRKISNSVVAANIISEKRRRWSSVIKPTAPQMNEDKSLSEMMADVRDCRYLRRSVTSSSTESDS